jgi:hypothetical protein
MHDIGIQIPMNEILYDTETAVLTDLPYDFVAFSRRAAVLTDLQSGSIEI